MMNISIRRPWRLIRFSLRTFFIAVTVLCLWLGYEFNWIRQRHAFLARQHQIAHEFNLATIDFDYVVPRVEILSRSSPSAGLLRLLGEEDNSAMDVLVVVDDDAVDMSCPIDAYIEVRTAQRLFPEALIVVGILPKRDYLRRPPAPPAEFEDEVPEIDP